MPERVDSVVVGAGVVGLAVARALALAGRAPLVLEAGTLVGAETSSRNSEVVHAGMYYAAGSLRARLCVRGRALLYEFAARAGVPHRRIGKLIVAVDEAERSALEGIAARAEANGLRAKTGCGGSARRSCAAQSPPCAASPPCTRPRPASWTATP